MEWAKYSEAMFTPKVVWGEILKTMAPTEADVAAAIEAPRELHFVFDGPPGPDGCRLIEVNDETGRSVRVGHWSELSDGLWSLTLTDENFEKVRADEKKIARIEEGSAVQHRLGGWRRGTGIAVARVQAGVIVKVRARSGTAIEEVEARTGVVWVVEWRSGREIVPECLLTDRIVRRIDRDIVTSVVAASAVVFAWLLAWVLTKG